jgi:hypothetical protein
MPTAAHRFAGLITCALFLVPTLRALVAEEARAGAPLDVPVKRVVLYSSGVGYFEHTGSVSGVAHAELRFKTEQINDVLKSLVVEDSDGGFIKTIAYPSRDPIAKILRSFQVDIAANPSLGDLLNQLRGAKVTVKVQTESISGTILGLEKQRKVVGEKDTIIDEWMLNLMAGATIRTVALSEVRQLDLEDAQLQEELTKALTALSQARDQDKKPVVIDFEGKGDRRVRLGYVIETPVWKTSYRLVLPSDPLGKPTIQGWAIIENQSDNDWGDVQLTLVSGRPISFIQNLYQPLYVPRPVVQSELYASLNPQLYDEGIGAREKDVAQFGAGANSQQVRGASLRKENRAARAPGAPAPATEMSAMVAMADEEGRGLMDQAKGQVDFLDPTSGVASVANAEKVGEFFQYNVLAVSLARQRSAMIPIVTEAITADRVSIYNQGVLAKNPLLGARLTNSTGKHLQGGPITVLDNGSYAGDARIDNLPPGQERLLSFAIDLQMKIEAANRKQDSALQTGKIVKGVLEIKRKLVSTQEYLADNKADNDRTLIVEHPLRPEWKLVDTPKPIATTDTLYRFQDTVKAGTTSKLVVKEEYIQSESLAILPIDLGTLAWYSRAGEIPQNVKDALIQAMTMKRALEDTRTQIAERENRVQEITNEQNRLRENMRTVSQNSQYYNRLLGKLNDQETQIEKLQEEIDSLRLTEEQQNQTLQNYLANLTVE